MDAAKTANDKARAAMNTSETAMNDANKAYTAAVSEKLRLHLLGNPVRRLFPLVIVKPV